MRLVLASAAVFWFAASVHGADPKGTPFSEVLGKIEMAVAVIDNDLTQAGKNEALQTIAQKFSAAKTRVVVTVSLDDIQGPDSEGSIELYVSGDGFAKKRPILLDSRFRFLLKAKKGEDIQLLGTLLVLPPDADEIPTGAKQFGKTNRFDLYLTNFKVMRIAKGK